MSRTVQQFWPAATDSPQRNGKIYSPKWSPRTHRGSSRTDAQQKTSPIPRTFAEFPFTKKWQDIVVHTQQLEGASLVQQFGQGDETWLRFVFMGQWFGIQDGGNRLTLTVEDADCPEEILFAVQRHFEPLLSRHLRD